MKTQKQIIIERLEEDGFISRNWCLKNYISRLSSIIFNLKKEGWVFKSFWDGGNFIYKVIVKPVKNNMTTETKNAFNSIVVNNQSNLFDSIK